jgi:hypothetical protein
MSNKMNLYGCKSHKQLYNTAHASKNNTYDTNVAGTTLTDAQVPFYNSLRYSANPQ